MSMLLPLLLLIAAPAEGRVQIPPIDECGADPDFVLFRADLDEAIEERDPEALLALMDARILASFGGEEGRADFARLWDLDDPEESEVWDQLSDALALGCALDGNMAAAPRFVSRLPENTGVYDTLVAIEPGAVLRTRPNAEADVVAELASDLMWVGAWDESLGDWLAVSLPDGRRGYVHAAHVRSPVDYRAYFEKADGEWRMTAFLAGD